jgi:hypothetical protein
VTSAIWIEEFPGAFKRHEIPAEGLTCLIVPHNHRFEHSEQSDMAKAAKKSDTAGKAAKGKGGKATANGKEVKASAEKPGPKKGSSRLGPEVGSKKIKLLVKENPRRADTRAHRIYSLYKDNMTVAAFIEAGGGMGDIRWDLERKNIELV